MNIDQAIITFLITYRLPAIFVGAFFFGETVIIAAAFLAGQGTLEVLPVFVLAFLATIVSDTVWFLLAKKILLWLNRLEKYKTHSEIIVNKMTKLTGDKPFLALLFVKFLYGTRVITIIYLSLRSIPLKKFVIYDALGTLIWLAVIIPIGWLAGKSAVSLGPALHKAEFAIGFFVILVFVIRIGTKWASQKLIDS
jgi:membrane protein DedA with SNARE-associated domain